MEVGILSSRSRDLSLNIYFLPVGHRRRIRYCKVSSLPSSKPDLNIPTKTVSSILTFVLAMLHYPEVQKKAQEELDCVLGVNQLPGFEHRDSLPYIEAIMLETLRWQPVTPVGAVHLTTAEEIVDGYRIPAGMR